jgi:hypothetical protein
MDSARASDQDRKFVRSYSLNLVEGEQGLGTVLSMLAFQKAQWEGMKTESMAGNYPETAKQEIEKGLAMLDKSLKKFTVLAGAVDNKKTALPEELVTTAVAEVRPMLSGPDGALKPEYDVTKINTTLDKWLPTLPKEVQTVVRAMAATPQHWQQFATALAGSK